MSYSLFVFLLQMLVDLREESSPEVVSDHIELDFFLIEFLKELLRGLSLIPELLLLIKDLLELYTTINNHMSILHG